MFLAHDDAADEQKMANQTARTQFPADRTGRACARNDSTHTQAAYKAFAVVQPPPPRATPKTSHRVTVPAASAFPGKIIDPFTFHSTQTRPYIYRLLQIAHQIKS
jgi:hypothetical protein